jgi:hypothetical protein
MRTISLFLAILGASWGRSRCRPAAGGRCRGAAWRRASSPSAALLNPWIFDGLYERMVHKTLYNPSFAIPHVVRTARESSPSTPTARFSGAARTTARSTRRCVKDRNGVFRRTRSPGSTPAPREVLMIG